MTFQTNPELRLAREFVEFTNRNVFLTGKAGTGKTTFLHNLQKELPKRMVVVAPTGVAAINAGGVTIHSFFQLPFGPILPGSTGGSGQEARHPHRYSRQKIDILRTLDLLIIDEVSMVRADLLDGIDEVLRRFRKSNKPFGGVQLLMIGDLQQLAPVVKEDEWQLLRPHYQSAFFFGSHALQKTDYVSIELKHIFRQQDEQFIELLNKIRDNRLDTRGLNLLNKCHRPEVLKGNLEGYITLTTHNYQSRRINNARLEALAGNPRKFPAIVEGNFPESNFPTDYELVLKTGAQVMFVKNDSSPDKLYYNGKIGKVTGFSKETIFVKCPDDPEAIAVKPDSWDNTKYKIDEETREIREEVEGTFTQYPLKTAWAITIHKSQGLTFEKAIIDANAAFAHGQVYVALSRCKTLEGLVLTNPLDVRALKTDPEVKNFIRNVEENPADDDALEQSKRNYRFSLLKEMFDFTSLERQLAYALRVVYENKSSVGTELPVELGKMKTLVTSELKPVAEKFIAQVERIINEKGNKGNESLLQDRLKKACAWFYQQTGKGLANPFEKFTIETDNKAVRKTLNQAFERLRDEIMVRRYTFDGCRDGFAVKKYLEAKAKGLLENGKIPKSSAAKQKSVSASVAHPELYARLKSWRDEQADESNRPVYMILQVKSMRHIADTLPASLKALKKIHGFGKSKLEQYGREVLDIVLDYCKEKNLALPGDEKEIYEIPPPPPKKEKVDTKQVTFNLFKKGKNIDEIAKERQLTRGTIYNHISHFVRKGEVNVFQFVSSEKVKAVEAWLKENHADTLTRIKQHFGDEVSWDELRLIINHVAFTRNEDVLKPVNR
jgi:hypothetical protein